MFFSALLCAEVLLQMDYSTYTIAFTQEGPRRVHLFSYVLGSPRTTVIAGLPDVLAALVVHRRALWVSPIPTLML